MTDLIVTGWTGYRLIFPTLINYHAVLWFSDSRMLYALSGFFPLALAYMTGSAAILEILFLSGSGMSALFLRQVLQESKALVSVFISFFLLLHTVAFSSSYSWSSAFLIGNFLTIVSIVYYQGVKD